VGVRNTACGYTLALHDEEGSVNIARAASAWVRRTNNRPLTELGTFKMPKNMRRDTSRAANGSEGTALNAASMVARG
jgi:hypothetical protein